jgi:hypothetical protein
LLSVLELFDDESDDGEVDEDESEEDDDEDEEELLSLSLYRDGRFFPPLRLSVL